MIVDMHHHAVPPEALLRIRKDPGRYGGRVEDTAQGPKVTFEDGWDGPLRVFERMTAMEARRAHMEELGIDGAVLSVWVNFHRYRLPPAKGLALSAMLNDTLAQWIRDEKNLKAMATVPLQDGALAAQELRRAKEDLHMPGAMIMTHVGDLNLDAGHLEPFWEAAESLRTPVFLHPADVAGKDRMECYFLQNLLGNPFDTTIAAASLIMSGVMDRHPDLEIVLAHGGGYLSLAAGRLAHGYAHAPGVTFPSAHPPDHYLRRFYYDTILYRPEALQYLARLVGWDRILFGTDYPFHMEPPDPLAMLGTLGLGEDVLGQAARLYGFDRSGEGNR